MAGKNENSVGGARSQGNGGIKGASGSDRTEPDACHKRRQEHEPLPAQVLAHPQPVVDVPSVPLLLGQVHETLEACTLPSLHSEAGGKIGKEKNSSHTKDARG